MLGKFSCVIIHKTESIGGQAGRLVGGAVSFFKAIIICDGLSLEAPL